MKYIDTLLNPLDYKFLGGSKINLNDFLLSGILYTGICPKSFSPLSASFSKNYGNIMKYLKSV